MADLESYCSCAICLEAFDELERKPRSLHCGHTYCEACLTRLLDSSGSVRCPACQKSQKAEDLSVNYLVLGMANDLGAKTIEEHDTLKLELYRRQNEQAARINATLLTEAPQIPWPTTAPSAEVVLSPGEINISSMSGYPGPPGYWDATTLGPANGTQGPYSYGPEPVVIPIHSYSPCDEQHWYRHRALRWSEATFGQKVCFFLVVLFCLLCFGFFLFWLIQLIAFQTVNPF